MAGLGEILQTSGGIWSKVKTGSRGKKIEGGEGNKRYSWRRAGGRVGGTIIPLKSELECSP